MPKIELVGRPASESSNPAPSSPTQMGRPGQMTPSQQSAREKAIAALMGHSASPTGNTQSTPVQNPSQISVEETTNLNKKAPEEKLETAPAEERNDTVEAAQPEPEKAEAEQPKEATQPEKQEEPLSQQYAVLARKEKALRAREQSFKQREAALQAREAELSKPSTAVDTSKYISIDDLKRDTYGVLQRHGVSYDDISTQALQAQSPEFQAMARMREEIDAKLAKLEQEQVKVKSTFEESQTQAYQGALKQIKSEAQSLIQNDQAFETIKEMGAVQDVVDLIEKTFKEDGQLLTVEEAATQVEEYLIEEALRLARLQKVQSRLKPAPSAAKPAQQPASQANQQPPAKQMTTLSNSTNSSRQLSARERALLAFRGEKI